MSCCTKWPGLHKKSKSEREPGVPLGLDLKLKESPEFYLFCWCLILFSCFFIFEFLLWLGASKAGSGLGLWNAIWNNCSEDLAVSLQFWASRTT